MITFDDIPLLMPTPAVCEWVERNIPPQDAQHFAQRVWPGKNLRHQTFLQHVQPRPVRLNTVSWPQGASRWATGYFLATGDDAKKLRKKLYPDSENPQQGWLVLNDEHGDNKSDNFFSGLFYMLPPRPLTCPEIASESEDSLYLLTLVDARYFWWFKDSGAIDERETWESLLGYLEDQGGFSLTIDPIGGDFSDYLKPDPDSWSQKYEPIPLLLDSAAFNAGLRIVRRPSGELRAMNWDESRKVQEINEKKEFKKIAGGDFDKEDVAASLPEVVRSTFPIVRDGNLTDEFYVVDVRTNIGVFSEVNWWATITGHAGAKVFHNTAKACLTGEDTDPSNMVELELLAKQIALDYYRHQAFADRDAVYAGIQDWRPCGFTDLIEWVYRKGHVYTRVQRQPWNQWPDELLHFSGECEVVCTAGTIIRGVLDEELVFEGSATLSVWVLEDGDMVDTGDNVEVYDFILLSGQSVASGKHIYAVCLDGRYELLAAQCEDA